MEPEQKLQIEFLEAINRFIHFAAKKYGYWNVSEILAYISLEITKLKEVKK